MLSQLNMSTHYSIMCKHNYIVYVPLKFNMYISLRFLLLLYCEVYQNKHQCFNTEYLVKLNKNAVLHGVALLFL